MSKVRKVSQAKDASSWEKAKQGFLFWKQAQGLSERTLFDYRKHLKQFFSPVSGMLARWHTVD